MNVCKKCGDCGECGENKYFTAFRTKIHRNINRISYKYSPHRLLWRNNVRNAVKAVNAVKKNNSPHFTAILTKIHREIHRISYENSPPTISKFYSIWFKFTRNCEDVSDSWCSGLSSWTNAGGPRFQQEWGRIFFCKNAENVVKINNSPRFTAFTAKRCKKYAVKIIFFFTAFHRISYENSPPDLDPGINRAKCSEWEKMESAWNSLTGLPEHGPL